MQDPGKETRLVEIAGRNIVARRLNEAQYLLLTREIKLVQKDSTESPRRLSAVARCYDILESTVVQEEDREFLMDKVAADEVQLPDLMSLVSAFYEEEAASKVRRGTRARK